MAKLPKSSMNPTAQAKELEKIMKAALVTIYPNCSATVISSSVGSRPLDPPALELTFRITVQITEKTP